MSYKAQPEIALQLSITANSLFELSGELPTVSDICIPNDISVLVFYDIFKSREASILYYFNTIPIQYLEMINDLEEFSKLEPGDKLSNFVYSSLDMINEFSRSAAVYFSTSCGTGSDFSKNAQVAIGKMLEQDQHIPSLNLIALSGTFYLPLALAYQQLLVYLFRASDDKIQTGLALTDKLSRFFNEIITADVIGSGLDLLKFTFQNELITIPLFQKRISNYLNTNNE